jgi:hypothetical protein
MANESLHSCEKWFQELNQEAKKGDKLFDPEATQVMFADAKSFDSAIQNATNPEYYGIPLLRRMIKHVGQRRAIALQSELNSLRNQIAQALANNFKESLSETEFKSNLDQLPPIRHVTFTPPTGPKDKASIVAYLAIFNIQL